MDMSCWYQDSVFSNVCLAKESFPVDRSQCTKPELLTSEVTSEDLAG